MSITRREALLALAGLGGAAVLLKPRSLLALGEASRFDFTQVVYDGRWEPRPHARARLLAELRLRTSIDVAADPSNLRLDDPKIFRHPFLYLAGCDAFPRIPDRTVAVLRRFLELGGFLLLDDCQGGKGSGFEEGMRRETARIFPEASFQPLPEDHTVFRSFYLLDRAEGRIQASPSLWGVNVGERTPIIYSANDLGGAWSRDPLGGWEYECTPGGEAQRERAFRLGVNLVMYALCLNYKKDQIHTPFILQRRRM